MPTTGLSLVPLYAYYRPVGLAISTMAIYKSMIQQNQVRVQELCESRDGRPGLSVLTSLMVSVDLTQY